MKMKSASNAQPSPSRKDEVAQIKPPVPPSVEKSNAIASKNR